MDALNWMMAHWPEIAKILGELTAALIALGVAISGLSTVLVNKVIPILKSDHPALPLVKLMAKVSIVKPLPVEDVDRPEGGTT
jgi:hypothetical protein